MSGKPSDPQYWRKWRAGHPDYRRRETLRMRRRRAVMTPAQRRASHGPYVPVPPFEPLPTLHQGHPILTQAKAIALRYLHEDNRRYVYDPTFDDLVGDITLALIEGRDPAEAAHASLRTRFNWDVFHVTGCVVAWDALTDYRSTE